VTTNKALARRAREIAARAPDGSADRRAFGCASVALATTASVAAPRRSLADECPDPVKAAALAALEQLTGKE
jgi:hypothetical protein